jgi:hypothetical protein
MLEARWTPGNAKPTAAATATSVAASDHSNAASHALGCTGGRAAAATQQQQHPLLCPACHASAPLLLHVALPGINPMCAALLLLNARTAALLFAGCNRDQQRLLCGLISKYSALLLTELTAVLLLAGRQPDCCMCSCLASTCADVFCCSPHFTAALLAGCQP